MRNPHPLYICYPSVALVGKPTKIYIVPQDTARLFDEGEQCELCVAGMIEHRQEDYLVEQPYDVPCTAENGYLAFEYTFDSEQEYTVRFRRGGKEERTAVYAVKEDLFGRRPLKGDFHAHSYYSDARDDTAMTAANYREEGFDFYVLTDHNRYFTSEMAIDAYKDVTLGLHIMKGEEIHTPGSMVHIVHAGGKYSVCQRYWADIPTYEAEVAEIEKTLPPEMEEFYRVRLARAMWACREIKKAGGLSIFAHPFWKSDLSNVQKGLADLFFDSKIFDAFELVGGLDTDENELGRALWQEHALRGNVMRIVGSSDSHNQDAAVAEFGNRFSYVFAASNTTEDILQAVRDGYCVAAEKPFDGDDVHFYAEQFRMIAYARFLYNHYFNQTWCICNGEGNLMRRYLRGEVDGAILSALAGSVTDFYERFFGSKPPIPVSAARLAFRDKWRAVQQAGPITGGARLNLFRNNGRRE